MYSSKHAGSTTVAEICINLGLSARLEGVDLVSAHARRCRQFVHATVEGVVPGLLHIVKICHAAMLNNVLGFGFKRASGRRIGYSPSATRRSLQKM